jgi:hypothetical protein
MKSISTKKAASPVAKSGELKNLSSPLENDPSIRILKSGTCESLSGNVEVSWQLGAKSNGDSGRPEILLRVTGSTGAGFFSPVWIPLQSIADIFGKLQAEQPITSAVLDSLYSGSINSRAYLLSILRELSIVVPYEGRLRSFQKADPSKFNAEIERLLTATPNPVG